MRKVPLLLILLMIPAQLMALSTKDVLALVAMPLAVAAVADAAGVPEDQLVDLVSTLNQANVPPQQFVEVIDYVPVAVTQPAQPAQPTYVEFVRTETSRGITGDALLASIRRQFVATGLASSDPLALIALPLAVAAVSEVTGVPESQLADLVATLNSANVPVTQEIQVIRYVPVALVDNNAPQFVDFVQTQVTQGVTGPALVPVVVQRLQTFYPQPQRVVVTAPAQRVVIDDDFVRPVHPHGGPPGQLKKQLGLKTGAEVVHGRQMPQPMISSGRVENENRGHGKGHKKDVLIVPPNVMAPVEPVVVQQRGGGEGHGKDHEKGGGKGKGHGKDH
jgi:hypothetical protein